MKIIFYPSILFSIPHQTVNYTLPVGMGMLKSKQPHSTQSYFNQHSRNNSQDDLFSDCLDLDENCYV